LLLLLTLFILLLLLFVLLVPLLSRHDAFQQGLHVVC